MSGDRKATLMAQSRKNKRGLSWIREQTLKLLLFGFLVLTAPLAKLEPFFQLFRRSPRDQAEPSS